MKVLIVNSSDLVGGAARAAMRLHRALLSEGVDSSMLVQQKSSDYPSVFDPVSRIRKYWGRLGPILDSIPVRAYKKRSPALFSPSELPFSPIIGQLRDSGADIVHLNWICAGMLRIEDLMKIQVPIVWTLHDEWAFTGGCHIKWDCKKYLSECGACPVLGSTRKRDLSRRGFLRKKKTYERSPDMIITCVSRWLASCAKESTLLRNHRVYAIPNPLDTETFSPVRKDLARELLCLPRNRKIVLFGACAATNDRRKGYQELMEALLHLNDHDVELVVFGSSKPKDPPPFRFPVHFTGYLHDDISLRLYYSAADVMVVPSLQEPFGQTASEAMSCGTPVVAFAATGLIDIVDHLESGYLAEPYSPEDMAKGISWVLSSSMDSLAMVAREKVLRSFDSRVVARQHLEIYKFLLERRR